MSNPAPGRFLPIIDQPNFASYPVEQIGERGIRLAELTQLNLPLVTSFILPTTFLEYLAQSNQLFEKIEKIWQATHWRLEVSVEDSAQKIQHAILQQTFPAQAVQVIFTAYEQLTKNGFVAIKPSWVIETTHEGKDALAVKGEANFLDSLLKVWASLYQPENLAQLHAAWNKGQKMPAALFVQEMIESQTTAIIYTHVTAAPGSDMLVRSSWGVAPDLHNLETPADTFAINSNNAEIITSQLQSKPTRIGYQLDKLVPLPVSREDQFAPSLGFQQLIQIVKLTKLLAAHTKSAQKAEWSIRNNHYVLLRARPLLEHEHAQLIKKMAGKAEEIAARTINTKTQETNSKETLQVYPLLDTGKVYQDLHTHPYKLLQHQRAHLFQKLYQGLHDQISPADTNQTLIRLCHLTTQELRLLHGGEAYEEVEPNPMLGYRGALRLLHTHSLFDVELEAVSKLAEHFPHQLSIVLPFVRTASELLLLYKHLTQKNWYQLHPVPVWCEVAVPAVLSEWASFSRIPLAGVLLNFDTLHGLLYGIDPDHTDILRLYPTPIELLQSTVKQLQSTQPNLTIVVHISEPSCEVLECLLELKVAGIVTSVKPGKVH